MKLINLEKESYTLEEFTQILSGVIETFTTVEIDDTTFFPSDVYMTIHSILGYINERVPGKFEMIKTDDDTYTIRYSDNQ